jgi:hypothetical protein
MKRLLFVALLAFATITPAAAQEEGCTAIYTRDELTVALDEATRLVEKAEVSRALTVLRAAQTLLPCLNSLVDKKQLATFGRMMATASFYEQDEIAATRWGRMARSADPEQDEATLPPALVSMLDEAGDSAAGRFPAGKGLILPKGGAVFMNGRLVLKLEVRAEVPYLVQIFDGNGFPVRGHWQDGAAFPADLVGTPSPLRNPRWYDPMSGTVTPKGKGPKTDGGGLDLPMPQTAIAGGLLIASGAMYAFAGVTKARFSCDPMVSPDCPSTGEELTRLRSTANLLVIGAGVAAVGGVGVGVTGFLLDGSTPGLVVGGRFR